MPSGQSPLLSKFLKYFFHLLYHQLSWGYDIVSWTVSLGMWNYWIKSVSPHLTEIKILELGHGPGHLQKDLSQQQKEVYGLDLSPQMGRICVKRIRKENLIPKLTNGNAQRLPFANNSFHHVVATFPDEFILARETIADVYRILSPGGKLIIAPTAWITGKSILHRAAAWLFKITGQSGDFDKGSCYGGLVDFENIGFNTETILMDLSNSRVLHVIATKPLK